MQLFGNSEQFNLKETATSHGIPAAKRINFIAVGRRHITWFRSLAFEKSSLFFQPDLAPKIPTRL